MVVSNSNKRKKLKKITKHNAFQWSIWLGIFSSLVLENEHKVYGVRSYTFFLSHKSARARVLHEILYDEKWSKMEMYKKCNSIAERNWTGEMCVYTSLHERSSDRASKLRDSRLLWKMDVCSFAGFIVVVSIVSCRAVLFAFWFLLFAVVDICAFIPPSHISSGSLSHCYAPPFSRVFIAVANVATLKIFDLLRFLFAAFVHRK